MVSLSQSEEIEITFKKLFDEGYILTTIVDGHTQHIALTKVLDFTTIDDETIYNSLPETEK